MADDINREMNFFLSEDSLLPEGAVSNVVRHGDIDELGNVLVIQGIQDGAQNMEQLTAQKHALHVWQTDFDEPCSCGKKHAMVTMGLFAEDHEVARRVVAAATAEMAAIERERSDEPLN